MVITTPHKLSGENLHLVLRGRDWTPDSALPHTAIFIFKLRYAVAVPQSNPGIQSLPALT